MSSILLMTEMNISKKKNTLTGYKIEANVYFDFF